MFIDFSAYDGSFGILLKSISQDILKINVLSLDIEPKNDQVFKFDWLNEDLHKLVIPKHDKLIICFNPPFGEQYSIGMEFMKKSLSWNADIMLFLGTLNLTYVDISNYKIIYETILPDKSYKKVDHINNEFVKLQTYLRIYQKISDYQNDLISINNPKKYCFISYWNIKTKPKTNDCASEYVLIRRIGYNAGLIVHIIENDIKICINKGELSNLNTFILINSISFTDHLPLNTQQLIILFKYITTHIDTAKTSGYGNLSKSYLEFILLETWCKFKRSDLIEI